MWIFVYPKDCLNSFEKSASRLTMLNSIFFYNKDIKVGYNSANPYFVLGFERLMIHNAKTRFPIV